MQPLFQEKVFIVAKVLPHSRLVYELVDLRSECIKGQLYEAKLSLVQTFRPSKQPIDRVLQKKGKQLLVKWLGYGLEHDSWIDAYRTPFYITLSSDAPMDLYKTNWASNWTTKLK